MEVRMWFIDVITGGTEDRNYQCMYQFSDITQYQVSVKYSNLKSWCGVSINNRLCCGAAPLSVQDSHLTCLEL
jgi:hypothetical protein